MNAGKKIVFSLRIVGAICLLHSLAYGGNSSKTDPQTHASDDPSESTLENFGDGALNVADYVHNEVIVKFRIEPAHNLEKGSRDRGPLEQISLGDSLDTLKQRFHIQRIAPVFKNFKQQLTRLDDLAAKDKLLLNKKESRLLKRMRRSPKSNSIPGLDRIYRLEVQMSDNETLEQIVEAYRRDPQVEYAELNYIVKIDVQPNDEYFPLLWPLHNTGQIYPASGKHNDPPGTTDADIDAPQSWDVQTGSSEIIVAVVDTGVDYNHRDIDDNMWADANGNCGYDFVNDDDNPEDDHGHGTHVAGTIAAEGNNGRDIAGVCWDAKIMALKFLDETGKGSYADAAEAFYYAVNNGADVIANSWGKDEYSQTMADAINYAHSQGVIVVAAAGNDNQHYWPHYPASMENVFAVAATNSNDVKASSSNFGDWIDIAAPGVDILSLRASGTSMGTPHDGDTAIASGTSMACPHVAGVIALLLSQYPDISSEEILARLKMGTDDISAINPYYKGLLGHGRLNAHKALRFNSEGIVALNREQYSCSDTIAIQVSDFDIKGAGSQAVTLTIDGGDSEILTLTEEPNHPWIFSGAVATSSDAVVSGNGTLEVLHGQEIAISYVDLNYGDIGQAVVQETVHVDCQAPDILNVRISNLTGSGARIQFRTNVAATGAVRYGPSCGEAYYIASEDSAPSKGHDIYLPGLTSETQYFFIAEANDPAGNRGMDDNTGRCYSFVTNAPPIGLDVPQEYPTIQEAIDAAAEGQTVWVADGLYTGDGNRDIEFKGKAITVRSENGPGNCIIDCQAGPGDDHFGFYFSYGEDSNSVVDGFTITGAYNLRSFTNGGAGIACDRDYNGPDEGSSGSHPSILNCIITGNTALSGGGIACIDSSPIIDNCSIIGNQATYDSGGGIHSRDGGSPTITNCIISFNKAKMKGAGIFCSWSSPIIAHCLITYNQASVRSGGGICAWAHSDPVITNCTLYGNSAGNSGGGILTGTRVYNTTKNCILWNNEPDEFSIGGSIPGDPIIEYSNIKGGWPGEGNINEHPSFVHPMNGDYHLKSQQGRWNPSDMCWVIDEVSSPCIDAGDNELEFADELWPHGKRINMGLYGGTAQAAMSSSTIGNIADLNQDDMVDFSDLQDFTEDWPTKQVLLPDDFDRDGDIDLCDYAILAENWLISTLPPHPATNPDPADGSAVAPRISDSNVYVILGYAPGDSAVKHTGYFSDDIDDVTNRVEDANLGSPPWPDTSTTAFYVGLDHPDIPEFARVPLVRGKIYYWCVDEFHGFYTWPGQVWSFLVMPIEPRSPDPADGETEVPADPNLTMSWGLGDAQKPYSAITYDIYYGTDQSEVETSTTPITNVETTSYTLSGLDPETTYYWRIDTKKALSRPPFTVEIIPGNLWSFTTTSSKGS